ncbi:N-6 DNA methylase [Mycobacterium colombiense]|uniref:N-6 DNA methylase n=1 Tax=Mycobacterium colombiense TaxID=339268 RepID=UPI00200AC5DA|nr:N-6 DNA methylase [Mycobacterium colombiense]MCK8647089.1 N-6 DNA methylase [Mycobacterium colombiense]
MANKGISETETVVKRILPYLVRRGYDIEGDLSFELPTTGSGAAPRFVDISVLAGTKKPKFLIEAKRQSHRLTKTDRTQALDYGKAAKVPFVVLTNGVDLELINTATGEPMKVTDSPAGKTMIPHRSQLSKVIARLKQNPNATDLQLTDKSLPFRPGLPLKQLNGLFARCHSKIRSLEKDEDNAFSDFSKLLFLRLLEEKADDPTTDFDLPYSTRFHELAELPPSKHDQLKTLVDTMIESARKEYGDVITGGLYIKKASTYAYIVGELSKVSFTDSGLDTKGAAFEYFVRATLKGKRLGQYFTPRKLVELMLEMVGSELIVGTLASGNSIKVLDPACGTGGFLVFLLKDALEKIEARRKAKAITGPAAAQLGKKVMEETFYGIDANPGVASSAKMNMIISGDGHTNIIAANSLSHETALWSLEEPTYDLIISNPPFGTSEADLPADDLAEYPVRTTKGQLLFLQHMVLSVLPGGTVCTVIDEGALNTDLAADTRRWIAENARVKAVVSLPAVTFKPNKITVKSSVLMLERYTADEDPEEQYDVTYVSLDTLGYQPSGDPIRGFDFDELRQEFAEVITNPPGEPMTGKHLRAFTVSSHEIVEDPTCRLDLKYWDPAIRERIVEIVDAGGSTVDKLNTIPTERGASPRAELYVDAADGYAMVIKAGSSITTFGEVVDSGDWIEKVTYDDANERSKLQKGDVLLSSTGDGTLGKAAVFDKDVPAVADGHVTIIRVNPKVIDPWFLADYLREGFGRVQSNRLFTGSTGLIELTKENVDTIVVPAHYALKDQRAYSRTLRKAEAKAVGAREQADAALIDAREQFAGFHISEDGEAEPLA